MNVHGRYVDNATRTLTEALHEPFHRLTAPDIDQVVSELKPFYWLLPDLLHQLANQLDQRSDAGHLRDDRGPDIDPTVTAAAGVAELRHAADTIAAAGRAFENAHNTTCHLTHHQPRHGADQ